MTRRIALLPMPLILAAALPPTTGAFLLPDTGQTLCYDASGSTIPCAGTGQDGAYTINPPSYSDNGNGTITDNNTGLMWQKEDDNQLYSWYMATGNYHYSYNPASQNVCGDLVLGGYADWRLPTKKEVLGIVDYSVSMPASSINPIYFPTAKADAYWTATGFRGGTTSAWYVQFGGGTVNYNSTGNELYVRCVRGDQGESTLIDNGNGTVADSRTGLVWQQAEPGQKSWSEAFSYCAGLTLGGSADWRVPNVKELESLTNDVAYAPAIDTALFPNALSAAYWASTSTAFDPSTTLYVNFTTGSVSYLDKTSTINLRCVRGGQGGALGTLSVSCGGTGTGTVTGNGLLVGSPVSFSTNTGVSAYFDVGSTVSLHASPAEYSLFSGWEGGFSGTAADYNLTMPASIAVTAVFDFDISHKTLIYGTTSYYSTLLAAYNAAAPGSVIQAWATDFGETLILASSKAVSIKGGFNQEYTAISGRTTLKGTLTIAGGTVILENLQIQ